MEAKMNINLKSIYNTSHKFGDLYVHEIGTQNCLFDKPVRTHVFENTSIHFIVDGEGYFDDQLLKAGEGFVVQEGEVAIYRVNPENPWTYYWINVSGGMISGLLEHIGIESKKDTFSYTKINKITEIFDKALSDNFLENDKGMMLLSYFFELLSVIGFENRQFNLCNNSISRAEEHFKSALRFLASNYCNNITIADIAEHENVERHYLNRLFSIYSDYTPMQHLKSFRMEKAKTLLRSTDLSIATISSSVGYLDQLQFSRIFKKDCGVSPTKFRHDFHQKKEASKKDD